jgi:hypothetical protein
VDATRFCNNESSCVVAALPLDDPAGRAMLVVIAKITYAVAADGTVTLPAAQAMPRACDVPTTTSSLASLRHPHDLYDFKPGTDVMLLGTARPPDARATSMDVSLRVAGDGNALEKVVRVYGQRVYYRGALGGAVPGPAASLAPTPLVYENAYGGVLRRDGKPPELEWRNPAGIGFATDDATLVGREAPRLEDPARPLDSRRPAPAAFGPIASSWSPRREFAGTYDDDWARRRAPVPPEDFDRRYHSAASEGLWSETPLEADVWVEAVGVRAEGPWRFQLPRYAPRFASLVGGEAGEHVGHLDTYCIDADAGTVELGWRVAIPLPRKTERLQHVEVSHRHAETLAPVLEATARLGDGRRHLRTVP